jgi:hypothetical protein
MRLPLLACSLLAGYASLVSATALTYNLAPNEKACFFTTVEHKNSKVAFYFAVRRGKAEFHWGWRIH